MKIKIFDGSTVEEELRRLLEAGYRPATMEEVWKLRKENKIPNQWYDTGTIFIGGNVRKATMKELKDIRKVYEKGGRLLFLGYDGFDSYGRFVGVRK